MKKPSNKSTKTKQSNDSAAEFFANGNHAMLIEKSPVDEVYHDRFATFGAAVVQDRAIPAIEDGLVPATRRILYTTYQEGKSSPRFRKAAYFVGVALGSYHPHSDIALYSTAVGMSQWFNKLNPLLDVQGNNGNISGDSAAAMRYLEMRISKFGKEVFFEDFNTDYGEMRDNYDKTTTEPVSLPASFPAILNLGVEGIAPAYATSIPPHRVDDICDITCKLIENPKISEDLLYKDFRPDFPGGGRIVNEAALPGIYKTGSGTIWLEAKIEQGTYKGKDVAIVTELPYKVTTQQVMEKIATLARPLDSKRGSEKKLNVLENEVYDIVDLADKRDGKPVYLVIIPKPNVSVGVLINKLLKHTQLRTDRTYNMNVLYQGGLVVNPSIKEVLEKWLENRRRTLIKRFSYEIRKDSFAAAQKRAFIKVHGDLKNFISLVEKATSEAEAISNVREFYDMTEVEAKYVVNLKIYQISKAEVSALQEDIKNLETRIATRSELIGNIKSLDKYISDELKSITKKFGTPRQTSLDNSYSKDGADDMRNVIEEKTFAVAISEDSYVYAKPIDDIKSFKGKGAKGTNFIDSRYKKTMRDMMIINSHDDLFIFTDTGKVIQAKGYELDIHHKHISSAVPSIDGQKVVSVLKADLEDEKAFVVFLTKDSRMKRVPVAELTSSRRVNGGSIAIKLGKDDALVDTKLSYNEDDVILVSTSNGKGQVMRSAHVDIMGRSTGGFPKLLLRNEDHVANMQVLPSNEVDDGTMVMLLTKEGIGKKILLKDIPERQKASQRATTFFMIKMKNDSDELAGCRFVKNADNVIISTKSNKTSQLDESLIKVYTRNAMGNRVITLNDGDEVANFHVN